MKNFYVYAYFDPRDFKPFYVGKGSGSRALYHLKEKEPSTENIRKFRMIQNIRSLGFEPVVVIIYNGLTSLEACEKEDDLISRFGRIGIEENGLLTNRVRGNRDLGGILGRFVSREAIKKEIAQGITVKEIAQRYSVDLSTVYNYLGSKRRLTENERALIAADKKSTISDLSKQYNVSDDTIRSIRGAITNVRLTEEIKADIRNGTISADEVAKLTGCSLSTAEKYLPHGAKKWKFTKSEHDEIYSSCQTISSLAREYNLSWDIIKTIKSGRWLSVSIPNSLPDYGP